MIKCICTVTRHDKVHLYCNTSKSKEICRDLHVANAVTRWQETTASSRAFSVQVFSTATVMWDLLMICVSWTITGQPQTASSSAECSRDKLPFSFVRGQDSTMWDIVWVSPQGHRSVSVSCHFFLQAPQCPCSVRKRFSRDHCYRGRSKPGCRIVGSHTRWELTPWAAFQLCLHWLLMSTGCKSSHSGFVDFSLRYGDVTIFKMAAVRHLEFWKFSFLITWRLSSSKSGSMYKISWKSDDFSLRYGR